MKIGIALSGGGARGIAHLGVMKALLEQGYQIEAFSGVSSGAIAATFLACGISPDEVLKRLTDLKIYAFLRPNILSPGLLDASALLRLYEQHLPVRTFEQLKTPVTICTADILKGKRIYFNSGELLRPLLASSTVPVMFRAVSYQDHLLVDGGLLNNLPIEPLVGMCRNIVAVHSNPISTKVKLRSTRHYLERSLQLLLSQNVRTSVPLCDLLIEPPALDQYGVTQFSKAVEIFEIGYAYTHEIADKIRNILPLTA